MSSVLCPFAPRLMVVVLQIQLCTLQPDDETGLAAMEALTPDERLEVFGACAWFRDNPDWDRVSYANEHSAEEQDS